MKRTKSLITTGLVEEHNIKLEKVLNLKDKLKYVNLDFTRV